MSLINLIVLTTLAFSASNADFKIHSVSGPNLLTGQNLNITTSSKKGLVVVFLSAQCPCSNSHISTLKELSQKFTDFSFVGVHSNVDEPKDMSMSYFKEIALPFPVIQDMDAKIANEFKALKTPHAFVLSTDGKILYQGGVSNSKDHSKSDRQFLAEALEDLKSNKSIRTPEGRTLGCVISRGEKHVW